MGFKANQSEATQGSELKPEGSYECIIINAEEKQLQSGKLCLNLVYVIRNDIPEQKYKNAYLFHTLWKRREPTEADMQVNGYSFGQVMALGKAAGLPDGKDYESLEAYLQDLINKPIKVTIKHSEYNGKTREEVTYLNKTQYPQVSHIFKEKKTTQNGYATQQQQFANTSQHINYQAEDVIPDDDDLPF